jgi:type I restriction enzyme S subunit
MKQKNSWQGKRIREIGEVVTGRTPSTKKKEYYGGDYNLISPADLDNGKYVITAHKKLTQKGFEQCRTLPPETVLVGCIGNVGKLGMVPDNRSATNQQINAVICNEFYEPHFIYYCLWHNRSSLQKAAVKTTVPILNKTNFENFEIEVPPLPEQKKIAHILSTVQQAIEQQEQIIALTTELKKALMHKLFTEGLRGEPQKETEIGLVPESWELVRCDSICEKLTVGIVVKPSSYYVPAGIPAFRSLNVREDRLVADNLVYISASDNDSKLSKSKLKRNDVLIVRTGYPGTSCVVPDKFDGANCIDLVIARPKADILLSDFLSRFFNSDAGKRQALASKHGLAQQHLNVGAVKRTIVPLPSLIEQKAIVDILDTIDQKLLVTESKIKNLKDLFRTLLHQLMTAQIRVHELEFEESV